MGPSIEITTMAERPDLVADAVDVAWQEWGPHLADSERERWLREMADDSRLHAPMNAAFVAVDGGRAVGVVQLHELEIDAIRDRSPWVCGMVVRPEYRSAGVGGRLIGALEQFAAGHGIPQLWVFTEHAARFYQRYGWYRYGEATEDGEPGIVLTRVLS